MRIGRYEILEEVGRGGAGVVFRARSPEGQIVAVKLLKARLTPERRARFEREERLLASLSADGFVPLVEHGETQHGPFLVMPFLVGGTLRDRIDAGPLPVDEAIDIIERVANALGAAHVKGIVHRDVKPENVLFDERGEPLVADLGLAKHFVDYVPGASQSVSISGAGDYRGSIGYSAPEQLTGSKDAEPPADVFALGAVLYECLTGTRAFPGDAALEVVTRIARGDIEDPRRLRKEVPRWLVPVVRRALDPEARRRFANGAELADALALGARPRRGPLVALLGASALAGGIVLAAALWPKAPPPPPPPPPPPSAAELLAAATQKKERRDLDAALAFATRACEADSKLAPAFTLRGELRLRRGDLPGALTDLERAIGIAPRDGRAWGLRGELRLASKDYAGAVSDLARARDLDPAHARGLTDLYVRALEQRATERFKAKDIDAGLADIQECLALAPDFALAWKDRAAVELGRDQDEAAFADAEHALELDGGLARAWHLRGVVKQKRGDLDGALADLNKAIELDPGYAGAYTDRASIWGMKRDNARALVDAEKAVQLDPTGLPAAWGNVARARWLTHDLDGAIEAASKAVTLAPENGDARVTRAEAKLAKRDALGALEDLGWLLERRPQMGYLHLLRGRAKALLGDGADAKAELERARELDPSLAREVQAILAKLESQR